MLVPKRPASQEPRPTPNLFLAGAPKSGTTALASFLGQHPEVFVADKELSYFGTDLVFLGRDGERWRLAYEPYLKWFTGQETARYRVDRSVFYLYSTRAAQEIHAFDRASRIVAMVRNPVDQMHSQHSEMLFQGDEDLASFADALDAEDDRRQGRRLPASCTKPFALQYRAIARYAEQIERYLERFGPEQVHVVVYDDFAADAAAAYRGVLEFLEVDAGHRAELGVVNANKVVRSARLRDLLGHAPQGLRRLGRIAVRDQHARAALRRRLHAMNTKVARRPPLDAGLRARLAEELAPEVRRLEAVLGRDLSSWLAPASAPPESSPPKSSPAGSSPAGPSPADRAG